MVGPENLVWAPNTIVGQHDIVALQVVVDGFKEIDEAGGTYNDIVSYLHRMGVIASERK